MSKANHSIPAEIETVSARVPYQALEPIGTKRTLQSLLEQQMSALQQVLPKHVTPERLIKTLMVAINRQPDLLECTQESVLDSVARAAELGLDLSGTLGEAYLVPFNNKLTIAGREVWKKQATFIIGYRGLAKLARQSGEIRRIEAEVIHEKDMEVNSLTGEPGFIYQKGTDFKLTYRPFLGDNQGEVVGVYALVEFKDGGLQADFMTKAQVERIRARAKSKDSPSWRNDWEEMAKKTVFRRLAKWLPLSGDKYQKALEIDNADFDLDAMMSDTFEVLPGESKAAGLAERLAAKAGETSASGGPPWEVLSSDAVQELRKRLGGQTRLDEASLAEAVGHAGVALEQLPKDVFTKAMSLLGA